MKDICLFILGVIVLNLMVLGFFKAADSSYENRAKAAGYYETLPDNMKREVK